MHADAMPVVRASGACEKYTSEFSDRLPAAKGVDVAHTAMSCASPALAACAATRVRTRGEGAARWKFPPSRSGVAPRAAQSATANPARGKDVSPEELAEQSLEACGWGELLADLAEYASTRLGQEAVRVMQPPEGGAWQSEMLLDETEAAMVMENHLGASIDFGGIMSAEVRRALYKAEKYASLGGDELAAMVAFIASASRLKKTVENVAVNGVPPPELAPLRNIVAAMAPRPEVADAIKTCVDDQGGFKDGASPELRRARSQRAAAEAKLRRALQNADGQVTTHQGRVVLAVTPPAPAGALVVGVAAGGGLVLIEPPGVVVLNGQLAQCVASEESAIDAIRRRLTAAVAAATPDLFAALDVVTRLDVIAARARQASAMNACRPTFVLPPGRAIDPTGVGGSGFSGGVDGSYDETRALREAREAEKATMFPSSAGYRGDDGEGDHDDGEGAGEDDDGAVELLVELAGLRQPVLAAQAIRARRLARREAAKRAALSKKRTGLEEGPDGRYGRNGRGDDSDVDDDLLLGVRRGVDPRTYGDDDVARVKGPVAVDVFVPLNARCVVITGPNTGGKTAAMKAVGLASLMARSGLFVPAEIARLPWFDSVLVDIGDSQDLMQSLSTFSARLAKQRAILSAAGPDSLVLMDEVGTGTSPAEGAAIGGALLERLAGVGAGGTVFNRAGLTLATTHHGELKALKYEHPGGFFENAAVEFDEAALAPTYRLLWGVPGRSRALQIAERFGLEPAVVDDARAALGEGRATLEETIGALETARRGADEDIKRALTLLWNVDRTAPRIAAAQARVDAAEEAADVKLASGIARAGRDRKTQLAAAARRAQVEVAREKRGAALASGATDFATAAAAARAAEAEAKRAAAAAKLGPPAKVPSGWCPDVGDPVVVLTTGMQGKVRKVAGSAVTVQAGLMQLKVDVADVRPDTDAPKQQKVTSARARMPAGTRAAARIDALMGVDSRRAAVRKNVTPPPPSFGYNFDADDDVPTTGDKVRIIGGANKGAVGTVVVDDGGLLTVQTGRAMLKCPVEGVEFASKVVGGKGGKGGGGGKGKKKKKGGGLPSPSKDIRKASQAPSPKPSGDVNDLMAKFNRK